MRQTTMWLEWFRKREIRLILFSSVLFCIADPFLHPLTAHAQTFCGFSASGSMETARHSHTATLLPNGQVLIAGGNNFEAPPPHGGTLASAELYDPATDTFSTTGSMKMARHSHTATLLSDGTVLVAGGSPWLDSAELYDPATGAFNSTGSLSIGRIQHTATLLPNGQVLVAGGTSSSGILANAELYDPASGTFDSAGSLLEARRLHTATLLPNGKVLLTGGFRGDGGFSGVLDSAELYDLATGDFVPTGPMILGRRSHSATLLSDGTVLIVGGRGDNSFPLHGAEIYDPATGIFSPARLQAPDLLTARSEHAATLLPNGQVLIAGGWGSSSMFLDSAELYNPGARRFSATGSMSKGRASFTMTLLHNDQVLIAGGFRSNFSPYDILADAELYSPGCPAVSEGGVVNNASYATSPASVAPGSIAAVFGSNLNDGSSVLFSGFGSNGKLVNSLGGATVMIDNVPAPMFYATPGQLGVQIPFELAGQSSATIEVQVGEQTVQRRFALADFAPGIFTLSQDGRGAAAVLHEDGATPVTAESPARPGEIVVLYATGLGAVTPPLATGTPSTGNVTVETTMVLIDGVAGEVLFSGAAPGFVGLYQINFRIPPNTRSGADVPLMLSIGGIPSNTVTIAVQLARV